MAALALAVGGKLTSVFWNHLLGYCLTVALPVVIHYTCQPALQKYRHGSWLCYCMLKAFVENVRKTECKLIVFIYVSQHLYDWCKERLFLDCTTLFSVIEIKVARLGGGPFCDHSVIILSIQSNWSVCILFVLQNIQMLPKQRRAILRFTSPTSAATFYKRYQRKIIDLSLITVSLVPQ